MGSAGCSSRRQCSCESLLVNSQAIPVSVHGSSIQSRQARGRLVWRDYLVGFGRAEVTALHGALHNPRGRLPFECDSAPVKSTHCTDGNGRPVDGFRAELDHLDRPIASIGVPMWLPRLGTPVEPKRVDRQANAEEAFESVGLVPPHSTSPATASPATGIAWAWGSDSPKAINRPQLATVSRFPYFLSDRADQVGVRNSPGRDSFPIPTEDDVVGAR